MRSTHEELVDQVAARRAGWARAGLSCSVDLEPGLSIALAREGVGSASIDVRPGAVETSLLREGMPALEATTPTTSSDDFGRLLDGIVELLAAPPDERETKRKKRERKRAARDFWAQQQRIVQSRCDDGTAGLAHRQSRRNTVTASGPQSLPPLRTAPDEASTLVHTPAGRLTA